jgi:hypothetical protein
VIQDLPQTTMLEFYQTHLQSQLNRGNFLLLSCLVQLLQSVQQVRLETIATHLPLPVTFESRRRKLQRFLKGIWQVRSSRKMAGALSGLGNVRGVVYPHQLRNFGSRLEQLPKKIFH